MRINSKEVSKSDYFEGMIKRPRPSQQDGGCNSPSGRKESIGKKVLKIGSFDAPSSLGSVNGSVSTYLDDVLDQHAVHLLEDCSIQDLGQNFFHKNCVWSYA